MSVLGRLQNDIETAPDGHSQDNVFLSFLLAKILLRPLFWSMIK